MKTTANSQGSNCWSDDGVELDPRNPPPLTEWQKKMIAEGLADADAGRFADPKKVEAIFAKYCLKNNA